jgi:hypothetical protein
MTEPTMAIPVSRETVLKRKTNCPGCGRLVTLKLLASRHQCVKKRMGAPPGKPHARRARTEEEQEAWASRIEERAKAAFLKRTSGEESNVP